MRLDLPHPALDPPPCPRLPRRFPPQPREALIIMMEHGRQARVPTEPGRIIARPDVSDQLTDDAGARLRLQKRDEAHREPDLRRVIEAVEDVLGGNDVEVVVEAAQGAVRVHDVRRDEVVRRDRALVSKQLVPKREEIPPQIGPVDASDGRPVEDELAQILPEHAADVEELAAFQQAPQDGDVEIRARLGQVGAFDAKVEEEEHADGGIRTDVPRRIALSGSRHFSKKRGNLQQHFLGRRRWMGWNEPLWRYEPPDPRRGSCYSSKEDLPSHS